MYEKLFKRQEDIFKVIASQKRLEIIQLLTHGELSVNQMVSMLGIPQSNVSQHLGLLRQAGVLNSRKEGTTVYYALSNKKIAKACSLVRQFLVEHDGAPDSSLLSASPKSLYPLVHDIVCGMRMAASEAPEKVEKKGETFYFCGAGCKQSFMKNPDKYPVGQQA